MSNVSVSRVAGAPQTGHLQCFQVGCLSSGLPLPSNSTSAGRVNVLSGELDSDTLKGLIKLLHSSEAIEALIIGIGSRKIVVGDESGVPALRDMSVINEPYNIDTSCSGMISAITPLCCDYAYIVSALEYAGECVSKFLKQMLSIEDL